MSDLIRNEETGDLWRWRFCDECGGVVIERWINRVGQTAESIDLDEPDGVLDVPRATFEIIAADVMTSSV
jgi:hypothetical protein